MALLRRKHKSKMRRLSAEERLFEYARGLKKHREDRIAVLVKMSNLSRIYRDQRYQRSAMEAFRPLMQDFEGELVELMNGDIVCGLHGATFASMDAIVLNLRIMFRDDEELKNLETESDEDPFTTWFKIEQDYDKFMEFVNERYQAWRTIQEERKAAEREKKEEEAAEKRKRKEKLESLEQQDPSEASPGDISPLTGDESDGGEGKSEPQEYHSGRTAEEIFEGHSKKRVRKKRKIQYVAIVPPTKEREMRNISAKDLDQIETSVGSADLTNYVKREEVMAINQKGRATPVFVDRYVPLTSIQQTFLPGCNITSDPWFREHLRQLVDRRVLSAYLDLNDREAMISSFRTTVNAVRSSAFRRFEETHLKLDKRRVLLEFPFNDVTSDVGAFIDLREELQDHNYRICIGDMDPFTFTLLDRTHFKADFEKVKWTETFDRIANDFWKKAFMDAIQQIGQERVIMVRCSEEKDYNKARELGIALFQGSYITNNL